ncbi:1,3-beta-glucan synthase component bgs4 [Quillaja saponaria]|uniref:1,3-beta-glucan synthase component bgs4 n=1 Tax=Quillaja saponaria TaxID=32244 RepID=A0AAD7LG92_QUISA|nr:1,3-beta-glucan synthase component bgs4 [Quillaja saponaria]
MEKFQVRTKSFRDEDYNNRRVFLRSYPLNWGEDQDKEEVIRAMERSKRKKPLKKIILSVIQWSEGKVLVLRRFKDKIVINVIACFPVAFKHPTALISA